MAKKRSGSSQAVGDNETKSSRFIRVVGPRVSKSVNAIDLIGNCAGQSYEYTPQQVDQIFDALFAGQV